MDLRQIAFILREFGSENQPGHWQLQGYGHPQYTNISYPFPTNPPFVPSENPTGLYETDFSVPDRWRNDVLYRLRLEGVDSAYHLWVNGKQVGYNQGSRNAAEFDISNVIRKDEINTLKVKVYQWSDGSYIEDQDMWVCTFRSSSSYLDWEGLLLIPLPTTLRESRFLVLRVTC